MELDKAAVCKAVGLCRGHAGRPGTPYSVQMARFYVRAALDYHDRDDCAEDVEMVASEHVSNAVTQMGTRPLGLELLRM